MDTPFDVGVTTDYARKRLIDRYVHNRNQEPCSEEWWYMRRLGWPEKDCRDKAIEYRKKLGGGQATGAAIAQAINVAFDYLYPPTNKTIDEIRADLRVKLSTMGKIK